MASGSSKRAPDQSPNNDIEDDDNKPKIRSLLDIDPWLDVPGIENMAPPAKIARLVDPLGVDSKSSDHTTENEDVSTSFECDDESEVDKPKPAIRSLLDLNPFEVPGAPLRAAVLPAMAPITNSTKEYPDCKKVDGDNGEKVETAESGGRIPSLFEIDPFQGMSGPVGSGMWANKPEIWPVINQGSGHVPLMANFQALDTCVLLKSTDQPGTEDKDENKIEPPTKESLELTAKLFKFIVDYDLASLSDLLKTPGLNLETVGPGGFSPLTCAASLLQKDSVMMLVVREGANPNYVDGHGDTVLHVLAKVTDPDKVRTAEEIAEELLKQDGVEAKVVDREGRSPLMIACGTGQMGMVKLLIAKSCVDGASHDGSTALHLATKGRHAGIVQFLLEAGASPDVRDSAYETPLINAARAGDMDTVKALIDAKCDLNVKGFMEYTALHWAVHGGYEDVTKLLVESGADLTALSALVRTPLHRAVTAGHTNIVAYLLQAGSQAELTDVNRETPLLTATRYGFDEIVRLLLQYNVNPDLFGRRGKSALIKAITSGFATISDLLVSADCDLSLLQLTSVKAGGSRFQWLELEDSVQSFIRRYQDQISQPRPLKRLCRSVVRRQLGSGQAFMEKLDTLPVPESLRDFISLKEELAKTQV